MVSFQYCTEERLWAEVFVTLFQIVVVLSLLAWLRHLV